MGIACHHAAKTQYALKRAAPQLRLEGDPTGPGPLSSSEGVSLDAGLSGLRLALISARPHAGVEHPVVGRLRGVESPTHAELFLIGLRKLGADFAILL